MRRVGGGDDGQIGEGAAAHLLAGRLEVLVEGVRDLAPGIQSAARGPGQETRTVGVRARRVYARSQSGFSAAGNRRKHAPPPGEIPHSRRWHETPAVTASVELQRVLDSAVVVKDPPVALERTGVDVLLVLVEQPEEVDLRRREGALGRALAAGHAIQEPLVEAPGVDRVGAGVAVRGPADLPHDDGHGGEPVLLQSPDQGVEVGVEDVGVCGGAVDEDGRAAAVEEGVVDGEMRVGVETEKGVDVDGERGAGIEEEFRDGDHERADVRPEVASRGEPGTRLVHIGVERDSDFDLAAQPSLHERRLDVLQRREHHLRVPVLVRLKEGLVPHRHGPETPRSIISRPFLQSRQVALESPCLMSTPKWEM